MDFSGDWNTISTDIHTKFLTLFQQICLRAPPLKERPVGIYVGSTVRTIARRTSEHVISLESADRAHKSPWSKFLAGRNLLDSDERDAHRAECHNLLDHIPEDLVVKFEGFIQRVAISAMEQFHFDVSTSFSSWVSSINPLAKKVTASRRTYPERLQDTTFQLLNAKIEGTFQTIHEGEHLVQAMRTHSRQKLRNFLRNHTSQVSLSFGSTPDSPPVASAPNVSPRTLNFYFSPAKDASHSRSSAVRSHSFSPQPFSTALSQTDENLCPNSHKSKRQKTKATSALRKDID